MLGRGGEEAKSVPSKWVSGGCSQGPEDQGKV